MRKISVKSFLFEPVIQEKISFKEISYLQLLWQFCLAQQNHSCSIAKGQDEGHF